MPDRYEWHEIERNGAFAELDAVMAERGRRLLSQTATVEDEWRLVGQAHLALKRAQIDHSEREERLLIRECESVREASRAKAAASAATRLRDEAKALWVSGGLFLVAVALSGLWLVYQATLVSASYQRAGITLSGDRVEDLR